MLKVTLGAWVVLAALAYPCCKGYGSRARSAAGSEPASAEAASTSPSGTSNVAASELATDTQLKALWRLLDRRKSTVEPRARALLITELQGLTRMFKVMDAEDPQRPQLLRHLAESYVELRSAAERDMAIATGNSVQLAAKIVNAAGQQAISHYRQLLDGYPTYEERDDVNFYVALEYGWRHDLKGARAFFYQVIKETPLSANVPLTYFAFGELFRLEAALDRSRIPLAMAAFKEVTKDASPQNRVRCLAQERLARYGAAPGALQPALLYDESAACARYPVPVPAAAPSDAFVSE